MLSIDKRIIEENTEFVRCSLTYPVIKDQGIKDDIISLINLLIYEDILIFKDVVIDDLNNSVFKLTDYTLNVITEYKVTFNKNNIISISIEFSQLMGLYDISYINCYNFDLVCKKNLVLDDIFDKDSDYINVINKKLNNKIDYVIDSYEDIDEFKGIDFDQKFYIEPDGVVLCFSSYEISHYDSNLIEFKLLFSDYVEYLSQYTINNICSN